VTFLATEPRIAIVARWDSSTGGVMSIQYEKPAGNQRAPQLLGTSAEEGRVLASVATIHAGGNSRYTDRGESRSDYVIEGSGLDAESPPELATGEEAGRQVHLVQASLVHGALLHRSQQAAQAPIFVGFQSSPLHHRESAG